VLSLSTRGGIVKTAGLGDGSNALAQDHRQASLDDAARGLNIYTVGAGFIAEILNLQT
jgi:hypothetical protein